MAFTRALVFSAAWFAPAAAQQPDPAARLSPEAPRSQARPPLVRGQAGQTAAQGQTSPAAGERPGPDRPDVVDVRFTATLTARGPRLESGLVWRIFHVPEAPGGGAPSPRLLDTRRDAAPQLRLPAGEYVVNVAFGRASATRSLRIAAGAPVEERFVLEAGGLRVKATLASGEPAPDMGVTYDVYKGETDQSGTRPKVASGARPGTVLRLNAGVYHLVSVWGDANAVVRAEVAVEPGKLTDATIAHHGAKVTFKLVARSGGEAIADTSWIVQSPQGETIIESSGALPTHILAAGPYAVSARHAGRIFRREFLLEPGEPVQVEVVMQ